MGLAQLESILAHAAGTDAEVCGILIGSGSTAPRISAVEPAQNLHPAPRAHFLVDAASLLHADTAARAAGLAIVGFYHSHPGGAAVPSAQDRADAWPGTLMLIVGGAGAHRYLAAWHTDAERGLQPVVIRLLGAQR